MKNVRKQLISVQKKNSRLESKIASYIETNGEEVGCDMHSDLKTVMEEMAADVEANYSKDSFERLFWAQQLKAAAQKNCKQMRWHPTVIRWSLYLKSKSTTGYNALRKVIKLPSDRTLRDYTHVYDTRLGFQVDVDKQVCNEFKVDEVAEWQKYVGLVFDEIKVKEGIVYNKNSGEIIGYVNLSEVTNQLLNSRGNVLVN